MHGDDGNWFDRWVRSRLSSGGHVSRRSMLGRSFKALLALAGVTVAARPAPAAVGFDSCKALHGYTCAGKCTPNAGKNKDCKKSDTTKATSGWLGCCELAVGKWSCLNMYDWVCRELESDADRKTCKGNDPSGRTWANYKPDQDPHTMVDYKYYYLCTEYEDVTAGTTYATENDCADKCQKVVKDSGMDQPLPACTNWCTKKCTYTWSAKTKKWTTPDKCAGDRSTCYCAYPVVDGTMDGETKMTDCRAIT